MNLDKTQLLAQFEAYLSTNEASDDRETETVDLFRLFTELAGLKSEVKREARQVKEALDTFKQAFALLDANQALLKAQQIQTQKLQQDNGQHALFNVLSDALAVRDSLEESCTAIGEYQPTWRSVVSGEHKRWVTQMGQGLDMLLRQLDQLLIKQQVQAVNTQHCPLDPQCMQAVGTVNLPDIATGIVVEEQRKGFTFQGKILRTAEVIVNKKDVTS